MPTWWPSVLVAAPVHVGILQPDVMHGPHAQADVCCWSVTLCINAFQSLACHEHTDTPFCGSCDTTDLPQ